METSDTDIGSRTAALRADLAARRATSDARFSAMRIDPPAISDDLRSMLNRIREGIRHDGDTLEPVAPGAGLPFAARTTRIHK